MIVVEVLGRRGEVLQRVRLDRFPATVGRAWNNDVILQDPLVDGLHARIVADEAGALALEDAGSVNGVFADGSRERLARLALNGHAMVRLGRTQLRVVSPDHPVPAAIPDSAPTGRLARIFASPRAMAGIAIAGLLLSTLSLWLADYSDKGSQNLVSGVVGVLSFVALWGGVWAFIGRLIIHRTSYWAHITLAWLFLLTLGAWGVASSWLNFLWPAQKVVDDIGAAGGLALVVAVLATHAGLASLAPRRRRVLFGVVLSAGLVGLAWLGEKASSSSRDSVITIATPLKPLAAGWIPATSVEQFVTGVAKVKREVDRLDP